MLFKPDFEFKFKLLESLSLFLYKNLQPLSIALETVVSKVLGKEDPIRFFYYN